VIVTSSIAATRLSFSAPDRHNCTGYPTDAEEIDMAAWFALAAPYLPDIIQLALPLFTRAKAQEKVPEVVVQQITELQNAATQNADSIKLLATEMQKTIDVLQVGATLLERKLQRTQLLAVVASTAAVLAFLIAVYALNAHN
jgi:hypothetical protein